MKNPHRGVLKILIIIIVLAIVAAAFYLVSRNAANRSGLPAATSTADTDSIAWVAYTNEAFGYTIKYPSSLVETVQDNLVSFSTPGEAGYSTIGVRFLSTTTVDDSTGKWGTYRLRFDASSQKWIATSANEKDGSPYDWDIKPFMHTDSGLPVFQGGIASHGFGLFDYIVALSTNKFLLVSEREPEDYSIAGTDKDPAILAIKSISMADPADVKDLNESLTYRNDDYGYQFKYMQTGPDFKLLADMTQDEKNRYSSYMAACPNGVDDPRTTVLCYVGANLVNDSGFDAASFGVTAATSTGSAECFAPDPWTRTSQQVTLNGVLFLKETLGEAGLSHHLAVDRYKTYHEGLCYVINLDIESHATNDDAEAGQTFKNLTGEVKEKLEGILRAFAFTK